MRDLPAALRDRVTDQADLREALEFGRLWVAEPADDRGTVVGYAMAAYLDGQPYLVEVDVMPTHGRRGIGTRLVRKVIAWARREGGKCLQLVTFTHLPWNGPYYEKLGFRYANDAEHRPEFAGLMEEERAAGLDTGRRALMWLRL